MVKVPGRVYRIVEAIEDRWHVSEFENYRLLAPKVSYSWEGLPDWIKENVTMLKMAVPFDVMAGLNTEVKGLGSRLGNVFWLSDYTKYEGI